jgi:hypothetical protein
VLTRGTGAVLPRDTLLSTGSRYRSDRGDAPVHPLLGIRRAVQRPRRQAHLQSQDAVDHLHWNPFNGVSLIVAPARGLDIVSSASPETRLLKEPLAVAFSTSSSVWPTSRAQCDGADPPQARKHPHG